MGQVLNVKSAKVYINGQELKPFDPTKDPNYMGRKASFTATLQSLGPDFSRMKHRKKRIREKYKKKFFKKFGMEYMYMYPSKGRQKRAAIRLKKFMDYVLPDGPAVGDELNQHAAMYGLQRKMDESDDSFRERILSVIRKPPCQH